MIADVKRNRKEDRNEYEQVHDVVHKLYKHKYSKSIILNPDIDVPSGRVIKIFKRVEGTLVENLLGENLKNFYLPDSVESVTHGNKSIGQIIRGQDLPFATLAVQYRDPTDVDGNTSFSTFYKGAMDNKLGVKILTVPVYKKDDKGEKYQDIYNDHNITLSFIPQFTELEAQMYVVGRSRIHAINLQNKWGYARPNEKNADLYAGWNEELKLHIPFRLPLIIPPSFVEFVCKAYCLDYTDFKRVLKILNLYSHSNDPIYYKTETGTNRGVYVLEYPTPLRITPLSLESNRIESENTHLGVAVRRNYYLRFITPISFTIGTPHNYLNPDNPINFGEYYKGENIVDFGYTPVNYSFEYNVENKKTYGSFDIELTRDNLYIYGFELDKNRNKILCAKVDMMQIIEFEPELKLFYDYLKCKCLEPSEFIEIKYDNLGREKGKDVTYNWKDMAFYIKDYELGVTNKILLYVDDYKFQEWKRQEGRVYYDNDLGTFRMV